MNKYDLQTGDILLFDNTENGGFINGLSKLIKWGTHSNYTHVAMVLKDPSFIHPTLKGLYVWESSYEGKPDPQDGKIKLGVQITPLVELLEDYVNEFEKSIGISVKKNYVELQAGDMIETWADISKAKRILNYDPKVKISEGVPLFIKWFKEYYNF